jgi:deoxyadenosine/deoxycytidine kinase
MPLFTIDGIPGSGKTTLLRQLCNIKHLDGKEVIVVFENDKDWQENGLLEKYYEAPDKYGFLFQLYVVVTRSNALHDTLKENPNAVVISERIPISDFMFTSFMHSTNKMSGLEFNLYKCIYKQLKPLKVTGRIYLNCGAEVALERCRQRQRPGEQNLSLQYLENLSNYEDDFYNNHEDSLPVETYYIDSTTNVLQEYEEVYQYLHNEVVKQEGEKCFEWLTFYVMRMFLLPMLWFLFTFVSPQSGLETNY